MFLDAITPARARSSDPATSHIAADKAQKFASTHAGRILAALKEGPRSAKGLSAMTGLTIVQIDRRLPELERAGLAEPVKFDDGRCFTFGGYRVWKAV
jgi:hypothetical protein